MEDILNFAIIAILIVILLLVLNIISIDVGALIVAVISLVTALACA